MFSCLIASQNSIKNSNLSENVSNFSKRFINYYSYLYLKPGGIMVALCAPNPQVRGSVLELSKEDSPFHPFSGSIN